MTLLFTFKHKNGGCKNKICSKPYIRVVKSLIIDRGRFSITELVIWKRQIVQGYCFHLMMFSISSIVVDNHRHCIISYTAGLIKV